MKGKKKKGVITLMEEIESRESAKRIGEDTKKKFSKLIPIRVDVNTLIFIKKDEDKTEQIDRYKARLERDRKNY